LTKKDFGVKGFNLKVGVLNDLAKDKKWQQYINLGGEYKQERLFVKAIGGVPTNNRPFTVVGNVVIKPVDNVFLGSKFNLKYEAGEKGPKLEKEVEFKVSSSVGDLKGFITGTLDKKFSFLVQQRLNADDTLGLQVKAEFVEKKEFEKKEVQTIVAVDVAAQHRVCNSANAHGKLTLIPALSESSKTGIKLGLGLAYSLPNTGAVATIGGDIDLMNISSCSSHTLGFELKLK